MMKIKIIAFCLSLLMTLQMLPITQIGQMLSSNQWVEELPHSVDDTAGKAEGSLNPILFHQTDNCNMVFIAESKVLAYLHSSDQIPSNHSSDVIDQPPNLLG
jgi:hypothetical protein